MTNAEAKPLERLARNDRSSVLVTSHRSSPTAIHRSRHGSWSLDDDVLAFDVIRPWFAQRPLAHEEADVLRFRRCELPGRPSAVTTSMRATRHKMRRPSRITIHATGRDSWRLSSQSRACTGAMIYSRSRPLAGAHLGLTPTGLDGAAPPCPRLRIPKRARRHQIQLKNDFNSSRSGGRAWPVPEGDLNRSNFAIGAQVWILVSRVVGKKCFPRAAVEPATNPAGRRKVINSKLVSILPKLVFA